MGNVRIKKLKYGCNDDFHAISQNTTAGCDAERGSVGSDFHGELHLFMGKEPWRARTRTVEAWPKTTHM